jgi:DNA repair exonuclease SbcCD ATPase subunit
MSLQRSLTKNRWDSSDPERAPPPLPLNPQSPSVASRPGTSSAIQSAHAALTEKARESALVSNALAKRMSEISPEKSTRASPHRRMQSLQPGSVRDRGFMLESGQQSSPARSPDRPPRPSTPVRSRDNTRDQKGSENEARSSGIGNPSPGLSLTPVVRPSVRRPAQSILGENTPPQSATMLALQSMSAPASRDAESPLSNVTNGSTALVRAPPSFDALSGQILSLTSIATSLQKEMSQLSRRSRDNATDLMSLKEATNARDEDIRKSLRDLVTNIHDISTRSNSRDPFQGGLLLDNKPYGSSPLTKAARPFSLPRIPSPTSFAASIDRESISTPSLYGPDAPAIIALLEKIIREMGTREGQDLMINQLSSVVEKLGGTASSAKIEELAQFIRTERSMIPAQGGGGNGRPRQRNFSFDEPPHQLELDYGRSRSGPMTQRVERLLQDKESRGMSTSQSKATDLLNEDILKIIRTVKDSVAQGGGLTAEVKALVRELRGEVLGMGREIGRRLDEATSKASTKDAQPSKAEIERVIDEGLGQMKEQMSELLREYRRQSAASTSSRTTAVDYQEIYNAMRAALKDSHAARSQTPDLTRNDVIQAVKEAWENYKPEIEVQQLGLEREEVLACLREGLHDYAPRSASSVGATRDEVFKAVVEGLKHFVPPRVESSANLSRDEILDAVRECLEEFEFPVAPSAINAEITRDDMVQAVKEGLNGFEFAQQGSLVACEASSEEISARLQEIADLLRAEFKAVSDEAKENVAANGRDTEQVLDATKDGFDKLRIDIEGYVDIASGAAAREEFAERLLKSLDSFRGEVSDLVSRTTEGSKEVLQAQVESLREAVNSSLVPATPQVNHKELLEALRDGLDSVRTEFHRPHAGTIQVLDALQEGLGELRASIDKAVHRPTDLTANDEILDALRAGLDSVRSDIDTLREESRNDKSVATVGNGAVVPAEALKHDDIKNLEVLITQLRIKVEAMEPATESVTKDDLSRMEDLLRNVQESVDGKNGPDRAPNLDGAATREDVQAIETILRNTKARLDDLVDGDQAVRKDHIDVLETLILETRESLNLATTQMDSVSRREDIAMLESLVSQISASFDEMKERADKELENPERVTKIDMEAVEAVCLDVKAILDQMIKTDLTSLSSKDDLKTTESLIKELKDRFDNHMETNSKALEDRQAEIVGVGERVSEVKTFLQELQTLVKKKLEDGATGIDALGKLLEGLGETIGQNSTIGQDLKDMSDMVKAEFEESRAGVVGVKLEADERFQQTTESLSAKIDERVNELVAKYDEFQAVMEDQSKASEARSAETEAAVMSTRSVAEELKTLIDTLGSAVTDSLEKMEEASKTVFIRVEDLMTRTELNHADDKAEHQQTRDQFKQAVVAVEGLQGHVFEYQPKILDTVNDVLRIVGQHYEYSKTSTTDIQDKIEEAKPPVKDEPPLLPPPEKYDDSEIHQKLDRLVDHTHTAGKAFTQLDTLEKVHQQVLRTAADISEFLSTQTMRINDEHEDREKTLQETTVMLERRLTLKEQAEASIENLRGEEERLRASLSSLKAEQEMLMRQKIRMTADVSSLETALRLRREELHEMDARAEGLERRILEGVMDHSRVLLMSKSNNNGRDAMSRKRVQIQKPSNPAAARGPPARPVMNMALSANRSLVPANPAGSSRRILSLGQITNNLPIGGFKRSQSVRTANGAGKSLRKSSWGGSLSKTYGDLDKENVSLREADEENDIADSDTGDDTETITDTVDDGERSDTDTLRRSSRGTTVISGSTDQDTSTEADYSGDDDGRSQYSESALGTTSSANWQDGHEVVPYNT